MWQGCSVAWRSIICAESKDASGRTSLRFYHASETECGRTIHAGRHQQKFAMFIQPVGLREIPDRALRLIVASATQDAPPRMLVDELFCPLPHVPNHVHYAKRARSKGMRVHWIRATHGS